MSHSGSRWSPLLMASTSGATQPGVPHLLKMYSSSASAAIPKSVMTGVMSPLTRMFSGLMSRCMTRLPCISSRPRAMPSMKRLTSPSEKSPFLSLYFFMKLSLSSSRMMQIECSDSNTPSQCTMFSPSNDRSMPISLSRPSRLRVSSELRVEFLVKALAAKCSLSVRRTTSQTVALAPLPSLRRGLQSLWKPCWLRCWESLLTQMDASAGQVQQNCTQSEPLVSLKPTSLALSILPLLPSWAQITSILRSNSRAAWQRQWLWPCLMVWTASTDSVRVRPQVVGPLGWRVKVDWRQADSSSIWWLRSWAALVKIEEQGLALYSFSI